MTKTYVVTFVLLLNKYNDQSLELIAFFPWTEQIQVFKQDQLETG